MKKINLIFEGDMTDVDILLVPNNIYIRIDELAQSFLDWKSPNIDDSDYWKRNKCNVLIQTAETVGFVKWLNMYHCNQNEKVKIIQQHTTPNPHYKNIEF